MKVKQQTANVAKHGGFIVAAGALGFGGIVSLTPGGFEQFGTEITFIAVFGLFVSWWGENMATVESSDESDPAH